MKSLLAFAVCLSFLTALSPSLPAQDGQLTVTITESNGIATLNATVTGSACPGGWLTFFRPCGDPGPWIQLTGIQWIGNVGRYSAPYEPSLSGRCIEFIVVCLQPFAVFYGTATYP